MSSRKGKKHKASKKARGEGELRAKLVTAPPADQNPLILTACVVSRVLAGSSRGETENGNASDTPPPEETGLEYQSSEGSFAEGIPLVCGIGYSVV